jgi:hypothetical protein
MPNRKPKPPTPSKAAGAILGPVLGAMLGGLPGQIRLAAREQQRPTPFVPPPKAKRGKR